MDVIAIILSLIIIIILISQRSSLNEKIEELETRIADLHRLIRQQENSVKPTVVPPKPAIKPAEEIKKPPVPPVIVEKQKGIITDIPSTTKPSEKAPPYIAPLAPKWAQPAEPQLSFFERYPDLEKFIGENLVNKIGIAILVLAIAFFVKYAIDNNWIGPVGRVGIGVLCGGIIIGIAHPLRNSYKAFSSVLVGGGLAVLYFTITLAYHEFHLFSQTASFLILIIITCFAVALSLLYNKEELAVTGLIGGLSSPFMVSSGQANYQALFTYLIILNAGLLVIAYYKSWRILNVSTFALTIIVFGGLLFTLTASTYLTGFIYATVLYLLFFAINVANNVRENKRFIAIDFTVLLANTALYFAAGLSLLSAMYQEQFRGLFTAGLGIINLLLSYFLFRNRKVDSNVLYLLIGITLTFISLTAPIQLHGHNITLFWAAETVLLYWLYLKSGIRLMKLTSLVIWGTMLLSLFLDWMALYGYPNHVITIIANKGFITTLSAAISSYLMFLMIRRDETKPIYGIGINEIFYKYAAFTLLFFSGLLEVNYQFLTRYPDTNLNSLYLMLYIPAFVYLFCLAADKFELIGPDWRINASLIIACIVIYLFFTQEFFDAQYNLLVNHKASAGHLIAHWAGAIFMGLLFYRLILIVKNNFNDNSRITAGWILSAAIVIFLSFQVSLAFNQLFYSATNSLDDIENVYVKVGLPILWGLASFALMWLGMRYKEKSLRIISLTLFSITLVKLFVFDIRDIPPAGKIAAFFCLGILLLIVSFMYQKVKKIIVDDQQENAE